MPIKAYAVVGDSISWIYSSVCRIYLTEIGKRKSSLNHPVWKIDRMIRKLSTGLDYLGSISQSTEVVQLQTNLYDLPWLHFPLRAYTRITIQQIRKIFPECKKMPIAIALDYIRDRM